MLARLAALRINFLLVFIGAPAIILAIKMTSLLLPPKYYFTFSRLVAGGSEPFIVDPPAVAGRTLCDVLKRYEIPRDSFDRPIACTETTDAPISPAEVDAIYSAALKSDDAIRRAFREAAGRNPLRPLSDDEVRTIAASSPTITRAFEAIFDAYAKQIEALMQEGPSAAIEQAFQTLNQPQGPEDDNPSPGSTPGRLAPADVARIVQVNGSLRATLSGQQLAERIPPIRKSTLDDIVRRATGIGIVRFLVEKHYRDGFTDALRSTMTNAFSGAGLGAGRQDELKRVFSEINTFSWNGYVVSILLRLTPVFLFGLVLGALAGRGELFSIALAGGMAAFLLSWPLILMWERLVQSNWSDKWPLFYAFYAAYVVSFFLTARAAGVLGAWLREQSAEIAPKGGALPYPGLRLTWRHVAANLAAAIVINVAVYAWNFYLPLSGAAR